MGRILHLDPFAGAAGDMFVAMLLDLGGDFKKLQAELRKLPLQGEYTLTATKTLRLGLSGTYFDVRLAPAPHDHTHSHAHEHGHEHAHEHEHTHTPARGAKGGKSGSDHDHAHPPSLKAVKKHTHKHAHTHTHPHDHDHDHDHDHGHAHGHKHTHDAEHAHNHGGAAGHAHPHAHDHKHKPAHDHTHTHDHAPGRPHSHDPARAWKNIRAMIDSSHLNDAVKARAIAAFHVLAISEGKQHGVAPEAVTFHEVGAVDSIIDLVSAAILLDQLGVESITCGPVATGGGGYVDCDHGRFPVPAPATLEILRGVPLRATDIPLEMCTPTGAAMLKAWCQSFGQQPAMTVEAIGYGAGKREHSRGIPNLLRGMLGQSIGGAGAGGATPRAPQFAGIRDTVVELEANIDDMTSQGLADASEVLMAAGALDVQLLPATMKKSRPGHLLRVLCTPEQESRLAQLMLHQTSTFGLRSSRKERFTLQRQFRSVNTAFGPVRIKIGLLGDEPVHFVPEYEDLRAAARAHGVGLETVRAAALAAFDAPEQPTHAAKRKPKSKTRPKSNSKPKKNNR